MEIVRHQGMRHPQHDGNVAVGPARPPLCVEIIRHVVLYRADVHELHSTPFQVLQLVPGSVRAQTACHDLGILHGNAAEAHDQPGVFCNILNSGRLQHQVIEIYARDMGHDDLCRSNGVTVYRADIPTDRVEETVHLAVGVVKTAGAGPAVRTAVNRFIAELLPHPVQGLRRHVQRRIP